MEKIFENQPELNISKRDSEVAKQLADQLQRVHTTSYRTDCLIDFVSGNEKRGMIFNFETSRYNIFLDNLADIISSVQFSITGKEAEILSKQEKLLAIVFHEIRHRVQKEGVKIFTPDLKFKKEILNRILTRVQFCKRDIFWREMMIFEKEEFDSRFITAVCIYHHKLNTPLRKIADILFWEPRLRH